MAKFAASGFATQEQAEQCRRKIVEEASPWNKNPRIENYTVPPCNIYGVVTDASLEYIGISTPKTYYGVVVD